MSRFLADTGAVIDHVTGRDLQLAVLHSPPAVRLLITGPHYGEIGEIELRSSECLDELIERLDAYLAAYRNRDGVDDPANPLKEVLRARDPGPFQVLRDPSSQSHLRMRWSRRRANGVTEMILLIRLRGPRGGRQGEFHCRGENSVDYLRRLLVDARRRLETEPSELEDLIELRS